MAFKLCFDDPSSAESFTDNDRYWFNDHGLLVIELADGTRRTYSPHAWRYVEDSHGAGKRF